MAAWTAGGWRAGGNDRPLASGDATRNSRPPIVVGGDGGRTRRRAEGVGRPPPTGGDGGGVKGAAAYRVVGGDGPPCVGRDEPLCVCDLVPIVDRVRGLVRHGVVHRVASGVTQIMPPWGVGAERPSLCWRRSRSLQRS